MAVAERIEVADAPDRERYELSIDGEVVGFTAYRARPGLIAFIHTEVDRSVRSSKRSSNVIGSSRRWYQTPTGSSLACEALRGRADRPSVSRSSSATRATAAESTAMDR
jgi:hypothetical protein